MKYQEVERALREAAVAADHQSQRAYLEHAVPALMTKWDLAHDIAAGFTQDGAAAFQEAIRLGIGSTEPQLSALLARIDAGDRSDGQMEPQLIWVLGALEAWRDFQCDPSPDQVFGLALSQVEALDHEIDGADLDDFLADPRMNQVFQEVIDRLRS